MEEFNINNFKINTNYVIEASAGTGKTYNIVEIVSKLLTNQIPLNKILIVTYTDKATSELKNRIKEKLIEIKSSEDINNSEIYTIHSFCETIVKEFPITGNFNTNMNIIDDSYLDEFADIYIRKNKTCLDLLLTGNEKLKYDELKERLINFTKSYYLNKKLEENKEVVSYLGDDIRKLIEEKKFEEYHFLKNAESLADVLADPRFKWVKEKYEQLNDEISEQTTAKARKPYEKILNIIKNNYKNGFTIRKGSTNELAQYDDFWNELIRYKKEFDKIEEIEKSIDLSVDYEILKDFYLKWLEYKEKFKLEDFTDMIRLVHEEVLNNEDFLNKLQDKYKYVIIDEFQDTNRLQYDIFSRVFLNKDHFMIVVGDPKQSIYSFQGTDLTVYNRALDEIKNDHNGLEKSLSKNYRTSARLVEGVNELINKFKDKDNNTYNSFKDYIPSSSINLSDNKKEFRAYLLNLELDKPIWIATKDNNKEINEYEYSDIVAQEIVDLCSKDETGNTKLQVEEKTKDKPDNKRNVSFKDFCILCRTRSEITQITNKLKKCGIPYLLYKDSSLFKSKECAHFIALLEALTSPDFTGVNRKLYNKALYTDFFGKSLKDINIDFNTLRNDTSELILIDKWKKIKERADWAELVDSILNDSNLRLNLRGHENMQSLFNYIQIAQYILNSLTRGNNLNDVIKKLNDLSKNSGSDEDENTSLVEKSTDFDAVKIMTMHASKGLEFPIVISAGGLKDLRNSDKSLTYIHHNERDEAILTFGRLKQGRTEQIEEIKRLFYVAYTRAKYLLIAPLYDKATNLDFIHDTLKDMIDSNSSYVKTIGLDKALSINLKDKVKDILSNNSTNSDTTSNTSLRQQLINTKSSQLTHMHSYSSLSHSVSFNEVETEEEDLGYQDKENSVEIERGLSMFDPNPLEIKTVFDCYITPINLSLDFPRGSRIGTALHEIFERVDFTNYSNIDDLIKECFSHEGIIRKDTWINDSKNIVSNVLGSKLKEIHGSCETDNSFSLSEISLDDRLAELEFNFNFRDSSIKDYCNGFIDLVFKRGEYYSVLDWKSDSLNDDFTSYLFDDIKKHTNEHYAIQRVLYSYTLIKYLNVIYKNESLEDTFNKHFGGIYYVYLRACHKDTFNGIYSQTWSSFKELEDAYKQLVSEKI